MGPKCKEWRWLLARMSRSAAYEGGVMAGRECTGKQSEVSAHLGAAIIASLAEPRVRFVRGSGVEDLVFSTFLERYESFGPCISQGHREVKRGNSTASQSLL